MNGRQQNFVISFVLMLVGLFFAVAAVEVTLRFLPAGKPPLNDRPKAYFSPADSDNLQDFPVIKPKPANTFRIAAVGDSFTFGPYLQFDDAYPKRMERWLNLNRPRNGALGHGSSAAGPVAVEVINYGVPRFSTFHEVGSVKKALADGADLILMQITLNDPEQKLDWPTELIPDETGGLRGAAQEGSWFGALRSVQWISQRFANTRSQRLYTDYFFKLFVRGSPGYEQFRNAFSDIRKLCERYNVPVVAVVFPLFGVEVGDNYPFWPLHRQLQGDLTERAIPLFDISEAFRGLPVERLQVLPGYDRHPNEIAHRIAAEEIMAELQNRKLLPSGVYPSRIEPRRIGIKRAEQGAEAVSAAPAASDSADDLEGTPQ